MANLTFHDIIRFYPSNNNAVYKDLKTAFQGGHVTPFIGAGLSVFCNYKLWPDVLTELSDYIPDDEPKAKAHELIQNNLYLEAAEHIHKHYKPMLRRLLGIVDYAKIDSCTDERLFSSAVWVLPRLFGRRPLMTTNFDGVLEYVFAKQNCSFERVVEPHDPSLLTQIRQKDTHGLFKLHGDIGRETTSIDRLVFTQSQYDDVYCEDGELIKELRQWYQNQTLLFLGCSLAMDKTMEVLRDVASKDPGIRHFAIIGCKAAERSELLVRFGELGIDAIFYDDCNHDAVRVILENLLYETDQAAFQQLDEEMCRIFNPVRRDNVLMYDAGRIKFVGRTEELAALESFCRSTPINEWWAVTGPGGMGKSRLLYEFTKKKQREGWQIRWFSRDQYSQLRDFQLPANDTIIVLDDVQADIQTVRNWLKSMQEHRRRNRLRILLLERDGKNYVTADWLRLLHSGSPYSDPLAKWCHKQTFLHLDPLKDEDLKLIMIDCGEALGKQVDAGALLDALIRVDDKLRRPLYALAVAEAVCNGEDPIHWNTERVLDEMLNRELAFHYESLQYIVKDPPTRSQQEELEDLMARCCIRGHLAIEEITKERYPYLTACMERMSSREFFRCLGLLQIEKEREILRMNCPDLIREHLVMHLALHQGRMYLLFPEGWIENIAQISFLNHLICHHANRFEGIICLWNQILNANPKSLEACEEYADLLWNITVYSDTNCSDAVKQLEQLFNAYSENSNIRTAYAAGIFNLSIDTDLESCISTERRLTDLYNTYPDDRGIALALAKSLRNLTFDQNLEDCSETVSRLNLLSDAYPGDKEFSYEFAIGLHCLSSDQDLDGCTETVKQLSDLSERYPHDKKFAIELAIALRNLSLKQDLDSRSETIDRLTTLSETYPNERKFSLELARSLRCLSCRQDLDGCNETIKRLTELSDAYPDDRDFALELAMSLRCLIYQQNLEGCIETVKRLTKLSETYPNDREFELELAIGLRGLSYEQDLKGCTETVNQLFKLSETHPNDRAFSLEFARGLQTISILQDLEDLTNTVTQLSNLSKAYPGDREFSLALAIGLRNLSFVHNLEGRKTIVEELADISDAYSSDREISLQLAIALRMLSIEQNLEDRTDTINRLARLSEEYRNDREFLLELARAYYALTYKQNIDICISTIQKLTHICNFFPNDVEFADPLASALVNLSLVQTAEDEVLKTLEKSDELRKSYPNYTDIQISHAMTWFNLTLVQKEEIIPHTISEIIAFLKTHTDILPEFQDALDQYLSEHPEHYKRYQPFLDLRGSV